MSGVDTVEAEVRELVRRRGLDPVEDRLAVRRLVDEVVADYDERALTSTLPPLGDAPSAARCGVRRGGRLRAAAAAPRRPEVEEIWVNEPGPGVRRPAGPVGADDDDPDRGAGPRPGREDAEDAPAGGWTCRRRSSTRCCPDGSRLHVVIPDITRRHWSVNIRKFVLPAGLAGRAGRARAR